MKRALVAALLLILGAHTPAMARLHHGWLNVVACTLGPDPLDGCAASPNLGLLGQRPTLFTAGNENGQTWYAGHPAWNVAMVDYHVGLATPLASHVAVATASAGSGYGQLPSGCSYASSRVNCNVTGALTLQGLDFSGSRLVITCTSTTSISLIDNQDQVQDSSNVLNQAPILFQGNCTGLSSVKITANVFDGNNENLTTPGNYPYFISENMYGSTNTTFPSNSQTVTYNLFTHVAPKLIGMRGTGDYIIRFNGVDTYDPIQSSSPPAHGDGFYFLPIAGQNLTVGSIAVEYNTLYQPASYATAAMTSPTCFQVNTCKNSVLASPLVMNDLPLTPSTDYMTVTNLVVNKNVFISNVNPSFTDAGGVDFGNDGMVWVGYPNTALDISHGGPASYDHFANVTITNNILDPSDAYMCYYVSAIVTTLTISGNVNLLANPAAGDPEPNTSSAGSCAHHHS